MIYLAPIGGFTDSDFGILTTPGMRGIPAGIKNGMRWAADNQVFTQGFNPDVFFSWLKTMKPYRETCIFVSCPDAVGDALKTLELFGQYHTKFSGWPVAFVAQDGQEDLEFPPDYQWECLFVGGSTIWKMSDAAIKCIQMAHGRGKHIHIGRVNYLRRYTHFASLVGSEYFTCDGTRVRFERTRAINQWRKYMSYPKQQRLEMK